MAAVLELARIYERRRNTKRRSCSYCFPPKRVQRQGSIAFAKWIADDNLDLIGMINLDTIGNIHDFVGNREDRYLRVYSEGTQRQLRYRGGWRARPTSSGHNYNLAIDLHVMDAVDRENRYGDHQSFSDLGYPAIRFINAFEEKRNADPTDTIEFIEPDYLRRSTQAALALVAALADGPRAPANIALRERDGGKKELVWEPVEDAVGLYHRPAPGGLADLRRPAAHQRNQSGLGRLRRLRRDRHRRPIDSPRSNWSPVPARSSRARTVRRPSMATDLAI